MTCAEFENGNKNIKIGGVSTCYSIIIIYILHAKSGVLMLLYVY